MLIDRTLNLEKYREIYLAPRNSLNTKYFRQQLSCCDFPLFSFLIQEGKEKFFQLRYENTTD